MNLVRNGAILRNSLFLRASSSVQFSVPTRALFAAPKKDKLEKWKRLGCEVMDGRVVVYTDGSVIWNKRDHLGSGIGVYFSDQLEFSRPLVGQHTSDSAELHAIELALQEAKNRGLNELEIRTDSDYSIRVLTSDVQTITYRYKDSGKIMNVVERDHNTAVIERIQQVAKEMDLKWTKVKAHAGVKQFSHGNREADRLAREGSVAAMKHNTSSKSPADAEKERKKARKAQAAYTQQKPTLVIAIVCIILFISIKK